jgi:hypothetical protein
LTVFAAAMRGRGIEERGPQALGGQVGGPAVGGDCIQRAKILRNQFSF